VRAAQREALIAKGTPPRSPGALLLCSGASFQAKIDNDLRVLERLKAGRLRLLGVREPARR